MKSKIIAVFTAVAFSTIGLCSAFSHAADQQSIIQTVAYNTSDIASKQVVKLVEHGSSQINNIKANTYEVFINKPLLSLKSSVASDYMPSQDFTKKNKIFELATLFNDKLQQILARFSYSEAPKKKIRATHNDKPQDKNAINCETKKPAVLL